MSSHSSSKIDRQSFQTFLSDAFAVQESGLDAESVAALIEIQQFIAGRDFDLDGAMRMIAERALKICSASGVAIALLESNELVYHAGSGCAAQDIGRHVPAVLSVSAPREMREILRVENATTDTRIEAHICRQFGGVALLMLPICKNGLLAGVLQVLFDNAHSFHEHEVCTYRLMVGALEYGMLQRAHTPDIASAMSQVSDGQRAPQFAKSLASISVGSAIAAGTARQLVSQSQVARSDADRLAQSAEEIVSDDPTFRDRVSDLWWVLTSTIRTTSDRIWSANFWNAGAVASAVIALSVSVWVFHRAHSSNPQIQVSAPALHDAGDVTPAKSSTASEDPKAPLPALDANWHGTAPSIPKFARVRVGPNEVDYIADDVTIRQFESKFPKTRNKSGMKQVDFGDDVTVRYFANAPVPASKKTSSSEATPSNHEGAALSEKGR